MLRDLIPSIPSSLGRMGTEPSADLRRAINRLFDDFSVGFDDLAPSVWDAAVVNFSPRLDLEETEDKIILTAELAGLTDKDVQVEVKRDCLCIRGEKRATRDDKKGGTMYSERRYGAFERTIQLPAEVNRDKIDAAVRDGVLTVTIPKTAEAKKDVKKIPVHH